MKWMALVLPLLLSSCGVRDDIPPRQVLVPSPHEARVVNNSSSMDVTHRTVHFI